MTFLFLSSFSHKFLFTNYFHSEWYILTILHTNHRIEFRLFHLKMHEISIFEKTKFIQQVRLRDFNVFRHCWFWAILCSQYGRRRGHENCENA